MSNVSTDRRLEEAAARLRDGRSVQSTFPGGRVYVDRALPFLFVWRGCAERPDAGTEDLLLAESSRLLADADADPDEVTAWVRSIAEAGSERFGSFLIVEVWGGDEEAPYLLRSPDGEASETTAQLVESLETLAGAHGNAGGVELEPGERRGPDDLPPLLTIQECHRLGVLSLGVRLRGVYREGPDGPVYPVFLRRYRADLSRALRRAAYVFAQVQTDADLPGELALGTTVVEDAIWEADAELARVERTYRLLLLVAPTNAEAVWEAFQADDCTKPPRFHYRLLPVDPALLKRRLYNIDVESIADPALGFILRDKRDEIDRQISLLADRQTPSFLPGSIRLFGATTPALRSLGRSVIEAAAPRGRSSGATRAVDAMAFLARARQEIAAYCAQADVEIAEPQLRPDITGLMVSDGVLMVGRNLSLEPRRVEALIHHEVGTHVLTHANGSAQPLAQLATGLADYDEFQEGIAVVTEFLAGGLTRGRMRLLGARVLAVASVEDGASFIDTYQLLTDDLGFSPRGAFSIATRVHQSGGFTRDMIYLRGLDRVLRMIADGTAFEELFIGKFAARHIPILKELRMRGVLRAPALRPRVLDLPDAQEQLDRLRAGMTPVDLAEAAS